MSSSIDYTKFINGTFDNFYIEKIIGEGGMGVVYKAFDRTLNRNVALKVLKKECINKENKLLERFKIEAINIACLQHPNIINVFSIGYSNSLNYIIMEYVKGNKLSDLLEKGKLDLETTLNIIYKVANGLEYSHHHGIIHRDIKPTNIMINESNEVKIVDFGLSKTISSTDVNISKYGDIIGTPVYLAPELWESSTNVSKMSDVYSLGVVLYECIIGTVPFKGDNNNNLYKSLLLNNYTEAIKIDSKIPYELNNLINRMLKSVPSLRPDITEIINEIENIKIKYDLKNIKLDTNRNINHYILSKSTVINSNIPTIISDNSISKEFEFEYKKKEKYFLYSLVCVIIFIIISTLYLLF